MCRRAGRCRRCSELVHKCTNSELSSCKHSLRSLRHGGLRLDVLSASARKSISAQALSNIVLDELDAELDRRGHRFVRYADDCNIYVRTERAGQRVMKSVVRFIERRLRLKVNASKSAVARPEERHCVPEALPRFPIAAQAA